MKELFIIVAVTSIWVLGIKIATNKGMVLHNLGEWGEKKVKDGYGGYEAIITCAWCMPSLHTIVGYVFGILLFDVPVKMLFAYPIAVMAASAICGIAWTFIQLLMKRLEHMVNIEKLSHWDVMDRKEHHRNKNGLSNHKNYDNGKVKNKQQEYK